MSNEKVRHKLKYEIEWEEKHKLPVIEAIDNGNYDIAVVIDKITFQIDEVSKNISELVKHLVQNKRTKIIFKEFNVFIDEDQNKIFRLR